MTADRPSFSNPCVVHNPFRFHGGAEVYAIELASALDAPLYTNRDRTSIDRDVNVREFAHDGWLDGTLSRLPTHRLTAVLEYENFPIPDEHDVVLTSGEVAKAVIQQPHQHRYHVVHSPLRWAYDLGPGRYDDELAPVKWAKRAVQSYTRVHDQSTLPRIDDCVAVSEVVGRRISTYFDRDPIAIIYPPIETDGYERTVGDGYLLALGRLEPQKRVEELVDVVGRTQHRLKVAGTGTLEDTLRSRAASNVEILGFVSERRKRELLARADALVFTATAEDFGMVPVEALASGTPVIGVDEGFTRWQIDPGTNGILFDEIGDLPGAIERAYETEWDQEVIAQTAERYDVQEFRRRWRSLILGE